MPVIQIDGQEYEVNEGDNLLQACLSLGLDLPYFCWHPAMGSIGACRQCALVQYQNAEDQRGRIVMGCMTPVTDGAIISLSGDKAKGFREAIVESLMLNHPHDCPVCAEGGECHLQDMTVMVGHRDRHYRGLKNTHRNQYLGPLIHHEMNRCITCYRCTRYYNDYAGGSDLAAMAAHGHIYFGRHEEGVLQSEFAGNLVEVCPTGVFTDKTLVHEYTRKWDLQSAPSVCTSCAVGCNTLPGERYGKLKRVHNRFNVEVNGYFLCDRGRFGAGFVNDENRFNYPGLRNSAGQFDAINHHQAIRSVLQCCSQGAVAGIGSPRASVESNYLLRDLVGPENYSPGFSAAEQALMNVALQLQQNTKAVIPDIQTMESADAIIILGEDLTNTAPRIALALRQSVRNKAYELAAQLKLLPWQDAAIRNLAQDQLSPLFVASVADTRLDDVAKETIHLAPDDIARLGFSIAELISTEGEADVQSVNAKTIAKTLMAAQRPLIVCGTGCGSAPVMLAAAQIANALCTGSNRAMLCVAVPEVNSLGQAMLAGPDTPDINALTLRAEAGELQTLIVLENDLYRRGSESEIEALLSKVPNIIALDAIDNRTLSKSSLALPAASFAESEGTVISMEGRAQRHFPVFLPAHERKPSWVWLLTALKEMGRAEFANVNLFDDVTKKCAEQVASLAGITAAAPDHLFRNTGVKIPRQTHRNSGRTAMRADISVHEPKQPADDESPLAFSMEGLNTSQPGSLLPYVWSPGWNSNQSLHKFQSEVGGPLKGGTAGVRLLLPSNQSNSVSDTEIPAPFSSRQEQWQLVARHNIFGSDELSALSPGVAELVAPASIEISSADAVALDVIDGDGISIASGKATLEVTINDSVAQGCAAYSAGLDGTFNLAVGDWVTLSKADGWKRHTPQLIGSDGGGHV